MPHRCDLVKVVRLHYMISDNKDSTIVWIWTGNCPEEATPIGCLEVRVWAGKRELELALNKLALLGLPESLAHSAEETCTFPAISKQLN